MSQSQSKLRDATPQATSTTALRMAAAMKPHEALWLRDSAYFLGQYLYHALPRFRPLAIRLNAQPRPGALN
jgi:hypothetical protein